jgi:ABC-2 type transport system permease protein
MSIERALWYRLCCEKRNLLRSLRNQSRLKVAVLATSATGFEIGLFALFLGGLRFMASLGAGGTVILQRLFALFFLGMTLLLTLSALVSSYSTLFRAGDIPMLVASPSPPARIVLFKCIETAEISAGAYAFVVLPFAAAYAVHGDGSPWMVLWTALFSLPLIALTTATGLFAALAAARWFPEQRVWRRACIGLCMAVFAGILVRVGLRSIPVTASAQLSLSSYVPGLRLAAHPAMPGFWIAEGMFSFEQGRWGRGLLLWLTLTTTAMVVLLLVERLGAAHFHTAWVRVSGGAQRSGRARLLEPLHRVLAFLPHDTRALAVKDVRVFLRDPMQWSQSLIFFGLLTVYYSSLRGFRYDQMGEGWRNFSAFMNVFSVATVTCSLGSRFIYPQLSFEGQAFWLLGLAPTTPRRIVLSKFFISAACLLAVAVSLMQLSTRMLGAPPASRVAITWLAAATALAVSGLSTGLGTIFLDLHHRNPAAVVSGFGGTLNLILGLGYIIATLTPFGAVFHAHAMERIPDATLRHLIPWLYVWLTAVTLPATVLPLWLGCRSLARRDC